MSSGLIVKPFIVEVLGFGQYSYYTTTRGKALSAAWRQYESLNGGSFKKFLSIANARSGGASDRFGEEITVSGLPAFYVSCNRQYIQFVRPDSDVILNSHPYDVEPPEARRGTSYYAPATLHPDVQS